MQAKVKVKSISCKKDNKTYGWTFEFKGCDSVQVCGKEYALALESSESDNIIKFDDSKEYKTVQKIADFISAHSKETLIIEINDTDTVVGVKLVYG